MCVSNTLSVITHMDQCSVSTCMSPKCLSVSTPLHPTCVCVRLKSLNLHSTLHPTLPCVCVCEVQVSQSTLHYTPHYLVCVCVRRLCVPMGFLCKLKRSVPISQIHLSKGLKAFSRCVGESPQRHPFITLRLLKLTVSQCKARPQPKTL